MNFFLPFPQIRSQLFGDTLSIFGFKADIIRPFIERALRVHELPGTAVLGLPFVYAFVTILACIVLVLHFEYRFGGFIQRTLRAFLESFFAAVAAGAGAYVFLFIISPIIVPSTSVSIFLQGLTAGLFGILTAGLAYYGLGSRELAEVSASIRARIWRGAPEEGTLVSSAEEHSTL